VTDVISTGLESGERQAERDLGAIVNEVEHLTAQLAEHTTTLDGLKEDRQWISSRIEALERDLTDIPRVPNELATTVMTSLSELTNRLERLESSSAEPEPEHTRAPERHSDESEDHESEKRDESRPSILDRLF
jgi:chromosome segregation ATPase